MLFPITARLTDEVLLDRHQHAHPEVNFVSAGHARLFLEHTEYEIKTGSLVWIPAGCEHLRFADSADLQMWVWWLDAGAEWSGLAGVRHAIQWRDISALCRIAFDHRHTAADQSLQAAAQALAHQAWHAGTEARVAEPHHPAVVQAAYSLRADASQDLHSLAAACGLSRSRLSRLFHAEMGQTLVEFRTRCRLQRFRLYCQEDPAKNRAVHARYAGFGSYSQCYRAHVAIYGHPPSLPAE